MPLQAIAIKDFNTPIMRETSHKDELKTRIAQLYENDKRYHNYANGAEAISYLELSFTNKNTNSNSYFSNDSFVALYVGMFNDKPICTIYCLMNDEASKSDEREEDLSVGELDNLTMHTENLNRGIEEQFIGLICQNKKVVFYSKNNEIQQIIDKNH